MNSKLLLTTTLLSTSAVAMAEDNKQPNIILIMADGESIMPHLLKGQEREKPMVFVFQKQAAVVGNQYKLYFNDGKYELYDLKADRSETTDILTKHPHVVAEYKKCLVEHIEKFRASFSGEEFPVKALLNQEWQDPISES